MSIQREIKTTITVTPAEVAAEFMDMDECDQAEVIRIVAACSAAWPDAGQAMQCRYLVDYMKTLSDRDIGLIRQLRDVWLDHASEL